MKANQTIAQSLNVKDFPFVIKDKNENVIYYEDSTGSWYKKEYDLDGNVIYFKVSDGYWSKREYVSNGNRIYYENSDGDIIDNRPKQIIK